MNKEDYFKYYIQGSDHYLIPKDVFNELFDEMVNWRKESKELNQKYLNAVADYETTMAEKNKLKKKLEVPETCNLKTLEDYKNYYEDTTREQILEDTYIEYCAYVNLAHRYSELKKQLEEYKRLGFKHLNDKCNKLENQQKEFIKYLEDEINKLKEQIKNYDICHEVGTDINFLILKKQFYLEILQKYREIIGDDK